MGSRTLGAFVLAGALAAPPPALAQAQKPGSPAPAAAEAGQTPPASTPAPKPAARRAAKTASPPGFDALVKQADAARQANQLSNAIPLYEKALTLQPKWVEGWWALGVSNYTLDRYEPGRAAFRRVLDLTPENGSAWTFKGLCEFQLKNYDTALSDLLEGRALGISNKELVSVARYHTGVLMTRIEQYEQAMQVLTDFAAEGNDSPRIIEALGLAALRMPMLPSDLPGTKRDVVMLAGRASFYTSARMYPAAVRAFEELISRYPETPNVHYAYGVFLNAEQPDKAIEMFKKELEVSPRHPWSALQIAFEYIKRQDWEAARPWAEQVVTDAPENFVGHRAMGQVLLETGDVDGAIREFEYGVKLAPDSPALRFALARAYRRAGRAADAEREQAKFTELDRQVRTMRTGAQSVGGIEMDRATPTKPQSQ
jgi:tetratricopeptide (TPR) repeat protein